MLSRHYAPSTDTYFTNNIEKAILSNPSKRIGLLLFQNKIDNASVEHQEVLSSSGNLNEAANKLYAAMHRLDERHLDLIIAEEFPDTGIGKTINDKLRRASKNTNGSV